MNLKVSIKKVDEVEESLAVYIIEDYSLVYNVKDECINSEFYAIFDSLVLKFTGECKRLTSFCAYTNSVKWSLGTIDTPDYVDLCNIIYTNGIQDDRISFDIAPIYMYDNEKKVLQIKLFESNKLIYYKVSTRLIVGVSQQLDLCVLLLTSVGKA